MYKNASRFGQSLARRGKKPIGRNLVASDAAPRNGKARTRLSEKLDKAVCERLAADKARYAESDRTPRLVKGPKPSGGSN